MQPALAGQYDAYVAKLNPSGGSLLMSTYLGGTGMDAAYAVALDNSGALYVAGETQSFDFLSTAALESNKAAVISGFVVKLPNGAVVNPVLTAPAAGTVYYVARHLCLERRSRGNRLPDRCRQFGGE